MAAPSIRSSSSFHSALQSDPRVRKRFDRNGDKRLSQDEFDDAWQHTDGWRASRVKRRIVGHAQAVARAELALEQAPKPGFNWRVFALKATIVGFLFAPLFTTGEERARLRAERGLQQALAPLRWDLRLLSRLFARQS